MKKGKLFLFLYLLVLGIFIISGTAFAVRLAQLRRGNDFYAQMQTEETSHLREPEQSAVTPDIVITAPDLSEEPDGSKNTLGSLFLDYRTNEDSKHLIIYGHNGSGGKMFGILKQYESYDFFLEHPMLTVVTKDAVYFCPIFSVRRIAADSDAYQLEFADDGGLGDYIHRAAAESLYSIDPDVDLEDVKKVLTLSTCTGWRTQRLIVQALWM